MATPTAKRDGVVWRPGECPFCGNAIDLFEPTVRCPVCDRFHHRWCWAYNADHCAMLCDGTTRDGAAPATTV
jgi:hypothetical protein